VDNFYVNILRFSTVNTSVLYVSARVKRN